MKVYIAGMLIILAAVLSPAYGYNVAAKFEFKINSTADTIHANGIEWSESSVISSPSKPYVSANASGKVFGLVGLGNTIGIAINRTLPADYSIMLEQSSGRFNMAFTTGNWMDIVEKAGLPVSRTYGQLPVQSGDAAELILQLGYSNIDIIGRGIFGNENIRVKAIGQGLGVSKVIIERG